jgi:hypothetical protein
MLLTLSVTTVKFRRGMKVDVARESNATLCAYLHCILLNLKIVSEGHALHYVTAEKKQAEVAL